MNKNYTFTLHNISYDELVALQWQLLFEEFTSYLQVSDGISLLSVNKAGKLQICNFDLKKISRSELFLYMILTKDT